MPRTFEEHVHPVSNFNLLYYDVDSSLDPPKSSVKLAIHANAFGKWFCGN